MGFPELTAQFSVWKTTGKDSPEAWTIACQYCAVYSVFPWGMTSHCKIAQFNWQYIGLLLDFYIMIYISCGLRRFRHRKFRTLLMVVNKIRFTHIRPDIVNWKIFSRFFLLRTRAFPKWDILFLTRTMIQILLMDLLPSGYRTAQRVPHGL
jgi:hypothetical protein